MEGVIKLYQCLRLQFIDLLIRYINLHKVVFYVDGSTLGLPHFLFQVVFHKLEQAFLNYFLILLEVNDERFGNVTSD